MKAEIVSVGTELLLGEIVDTNAAYLARHLAVIGIDHYWSSVVGDNKPRIVEVLRRAWGRSDLVIVTGGLGPTDDDLTRESIAELMGETMAVDPDLERYLREFFSGRGVPMPERNIKQATLIPSCRAIPNPVGTAPGWLVERDGKMVVAMPGVPFEMYRMWEKEVLPKLQGRQGSAVLLTKTLKVIGMGESSVEDAIKELVALSNPTVATYAKQDGIHVRIGAKANSREEAQALMDPTEGKVRSILGTYVYGSGDDTLEGVVAKLLLGGGLTLALAEFSTGGWMANVLTGVRGKDNYFRGGLVIPTLESLPFPVTSPTLLANNGKASAALGEAIADGVRAHFGADIGLATMPMEVGGEELGNLYICLSDNGICKSQRSSFRRAAASELKRLVCLSALNLLRRHILQVA